MKISSINFVNFNKQNLKHKDDIRFSSHKIYSNNVPMYRLLQEITAPYIKQLEKLDEIGFHCEIEHIIHKFSGTTTRITLYTLDKDLILPCIIENNKGKCLFIYQSVNKFPGKRRMKEEISNMLKKADEYMVWKITKINEM
jgi:hypothetical protein